MERCCHSRPRVPLLAAIYLLSNSSCPTRCVAQAICPLSSHLLGHSSQNGEFSHLWPQNHRFQWPAFPPVVPLSNSPWKVPAEQTWVSARVRAARPRGSACSCRPAPEHSCVVSGGSTVGCWTQICPDFAGPWSLVVLPMVLGNVLRHMVVPINLILWKKKYLLVWAYASFINW